MQNASEEDNINQLEIQFTLTVGNFSEYKGINGKKINQGLIQGILAKQMLSQLLPCDRWMDYNLTKLNISLFEQVDEDIVTISSTAVFPVNNLLNNFMAQDIAMHIIKKEPSIQDNKLELERRIINELQQIGIPIDILTKEEYEDFFGNAVCQISKKEFKRLAETARIITNSKMVTPELFIKIQTTLNNYISNFHSYLVSQEKRTIKQIFEDNYIDIENINPNSEWHWKSLGYSSQEDLDCILNTSMIWLSSNMCHSQQVHFFVEQYMSEDHYAFNKLRNIFLDHEVPNVLLSIPGINLNFANLEVRIVTNNELTEIPINENRDNSDNSDNSDLIVDLKLKNSFDNDFISAKGLAINMWEILLDSAILNNCRNLIIPVMGLENLIDKDNHIIRDIMDEIYCVSLLDLLQDIRYIPYFDNILLNPITKYASTKKIFDKVLLKYQEQIKKHECNIETINYDPKMMAIEFAKKGVHCAIVNFSNIDFILGKSDLGHYNCSENYSNEIDIADTSTACIGSRGIQVEYIEGKLQQKLYTNRDQVLSTKEIEETLGFLLEENKENKIFIDPQIDEKSKEVLMMFGILSGDHSISGNDKSEVDLLYEQIEIDKLTLNERTESVNIENQKNPIYNNIANFKLT